MSHKLVVIGGGTGFIGSHLSTLLTSTGYNVITVSRMPGLKRMTWHELEEKGLPEDTVAAINVAGQNVLDPLRRWTPGFKQNVWNSRVNTSAAFVRAIAKATTKPDVFINVSGVSLYKPSNDKIYTEEHHGENYDYMSKLCLDWEKAAELPATDGVRQVRIRSGVVIGRNGGMIKSMKIPFWCGLGGNIGDGKQALPWIHIDDICELIKVCIEKKEATGVFNGVAPQCVTNEDFTKAFSSVLGRWAPFATPAFVINTIFGEERAALLLSGAKIQPKRVNDLNFTYKYPNVIDACREVC